MKKLFLTTLILSLCFATFSQVKIAIPYVKGQVLFSVNITYPTTIKIADSVRLEAKYDSVFTTVTNIVGRPTVITPEYNFEDRGSQRFYRVIVFQKGKAPVISNEIELSYYGYNFSKTPLPVVTNIKSEIVVINGEKYIRLSWGAVPSAIGYRVVEQFDKDPNYYGFQLGYGGPMSITAKTFMDILLVGDYVHNYGIYALNTPYEETPEISKLGLISVPVK